MPPKLSKKEQEEIARQEEERLRLEEEERLRVEEEEKKKYEPANLLTGLECILTEYYMQEVLASQNPAEFTREFVLKYLERQGDSVSKNFRAIDIQILVEFHLNNIDFACKSLFTQQEIYIFVNIMWAVLKNQDPKYTPYTVEKGENQSVEDFEKNRKKVTLNLAKKTSEKDLKVLVGILRKHSYNKVEEGFMKTFTPKALELIMKYVKQSYFMHFNLYKFVATNDQQEEDVHETIFVDQTQAIPEGLDDCVYTAMDKDGKEIGDEDQNQENQENLGKLDEEEDESKPEEDEPLDAISQQILDEKLREAQQQMEQQLLDRKELQDKKIEELQQTKGKKK